MPKPRIRERKDGTVFHQVRYRIPGPDGRPVQTSKSFDDPAAAERFGDLVDKIGAAEAERVLEAQAASSSSVPTLTEWLRIYIDTRTAAEGATTDKYTAYLEADIDPFMGPTPIDRVGQELIAAWIKDLLRKGNAPKTIANKHSFLSGALNAAAGRRPTPLIPWNPCAATSLPLVYDAEISFLEPMEYELLIALQTPTWHAMTEFAVMSMARPSEIGALLVRDINPQTGAVRITKAHKYANGRVKLGGPKSRRGVRTAFVPPQTIERLDLDRDPDERLFQTGPGGPVTVQHFRAHAFVPVHKRLHALLTGDDRKFGRVARWAGEAPDVLRARFGPYIQSLADKTPGPYTLRHTGISWRLQDGVPLWVVSRDAGHESQRTTELRYGHIDATSSIAAVERVSGRLPSLRRHVADLELVRRRRLVRAGRLGEVDQVPGGYEAIWCDASGEIQSQVFPTEEAAVDHVARHEVGDAA